MLIPIHGGWLTFVGRRGGRGKSRFGNGGKEMEVLLWQRPWRATILKYYDADKY